ncbi:MAG: AAA family ATPase [Lachnospiraceae bacterium]
MSVLKKKECNINSIQSDINYHILNIIEPSGFDFDDNYAGVGENVGKVYCISKYPADGADTGWLSELCNLEGTSTSIEYRFAEPDNMTAAFDKRIGYLKTIRDTAKKDSDRKIAQKAVDDLEKMIKDISVNGEPVGYFNILLHMQGGREEELKSRIKRVSGKIAGTGCNIKHLRFKQLEAVKAIAPYGVPNCVVSNVGERNMPMSTFTGGFPMANSGLNDEGGGYLGKTKNGRLVILNMWLRNKDRVNSNWYVEGVPGTGKSTFIKFMAILERALNNTVQIFWDAENEYLQLAKHPWMDGMIVNAANGNQARVNPLQIMYTPKVTKNELNENESIEDYVAFEEEMGVSPLALHIQTTKKFFEMYFGKEQYKDPGIRWALSDCMQEVYREFHIDFDTNPAKLTPEDYPIISDLYHKSKEKMQDINLTQRERTNYERLKELLFPMSEGEDKFLWNGPTNLAPKCKTIVFDTSMLLEMDDNVRNAQFLNLARWSWNRTSLDRKEKVATYVDEGYLFVDPDQPYLMKYFRNYSKRDRKYEGALIFITHATVDILDPAVKRFGQAIIDNACYKMVFGCDGKGLEETVEILKLTEQEVEILETKVRGKGILFAGNARMELNVELRNKFVEMIGQAGGR